MAKNTNYFIKFDLIILGILQKEDKYAYLISKEVEEKTHGLVICKQGTMYPFLYKLLEEGCITSYQELIGNKIRLYYHLEDKGREYYKQELENYYRLVSELNNIFMEE